MSAKVTMYSTAVCPDCVRAEQLLKQRGVEAIDKIRIDLDAGLRDDMIARTGRRTVPQIFIGDTHVGGFDDDNVSNDAGLGVLELHVVSPFR
jgi:glutaredoxin 3